MPTQLFEKTQNTPLATTLTDIYTGPDDFLMECTIFICNRGADSTIRLAVAPNGDADDNKHYLYYDLPMKTKDTLRLTAFPIQPGDVVRVYGGTADFTVNVTPTDARTMR